jgi:hypothetical protein
MDQVIENVGRRSEDNWSEEGMPPDVGENSLNGFERNVLFLNQGDGSFIDVANATGSNRVGDGRGVVVADFDRDGQLDLLTRTSRSRVDSLEIRWPAGRTTKLSDVPAGQRADGSRDRGRVW